MYMKNLATHHTPFYFNPLILLELTYLEKILGPTKELQWAVAYRLRNTGLFPTHLHNKEKIAPYELE